MMEGKPERTGKVFLVGAGPGDPELITHRGAALLRKADCVIYDRLVNPALLHLTGRRCERIYAGRDEKGRRQLRINRLLVEKGRRHRTVVRLKGGDPALFGRLSEEIDALKGAGIPFEVVPGVSSPWAAAAALGIPLTDRRVSSSVAFVTGHLAAGKRSTIRWRELARGADTLVILMGRAALGRIVRQLRQAGRIAATPVALIRWASTSQQELFVSTLGQVEQDLESWPAFGPPVIVIVGEVVRLAQTLAPEKRKLLEGKKILVTRPASDSAGLLERLQELGATCRTLPAIAVRPRPIPAAEAKDLLARLPEYDWVLFNSHHGVEGLQRLARRFRKDLARTIRGKVCAIGPRTERVVRETGLKVDLVPGDFSTEGIRRVFREIPIRGKRVLIPRSNLAIGDVLAKSLRNRGARVDEIAVYETVPVKISAARVRRAVHGADAVTFTSASTARSFLESIRSAKVPVKSVLNGTAVVAIGPATAKALKEGGVHRFHLPSGSWTIDGLVGAVVDAIGNPSGCGVSRLRRTERGVEAVVRAPSSETVRSIRGT